MTDLIPPPAKRRRMLSTVKVPMTRYSDYLAAFGATSSPGSVSKMKRKLSSNLDLTKVEPVATVTELDHIRQQQSPDSEAGIEEISSYRNDTEAVTVSDDDDDVIVVKHPSNSDKPPAQPSKHARIVSPLPRATAENASVKSRRSSRIQTMGEKNVATPPARGSSTRRTSTRILYSDTTDVMDLSPKPVTKSARATVRQEILEFTKPKRDAFLLTHKRYFTPVLPANNYVNKLEQSHDERDAAKLVTDYKLLTEQPAGVKAVMKPYQLEGLSFLVHMYRNGMPAILGDEMGLGKTLQTLSLFQYLAENEISQGEHRPHLVICPLSVLSSWISEARKWVPNLKVVRFHGPRSERDRFKAEMLEKVTAAKKAGAPKLDPPTDIVVTTYETFVSEKAWLKMAFAWRYCVLDEGHKIKNDASLVSSALQSLRAEFRLLLTGTPLQNNLHEMWALLHWLLPEPFSIETSEMFKKAFDLTKGQVSTSFMDDSRHLLELLMLRRTKSSPGVNLGLPPKKEILLYVPLSPVQRFWYTRLITKADSAMFDELFKDTKSKTINSLKEENAEDKQLNLLEKALVHDDVWAESKLLMEQAVANEQQTDSKTSDWRKLMNLVMQLRKVCSHPYLVKSAMPDPYYLGDHVIKASGKFIVLEKLVQELVLQHRKKVLIFSGFTKTLDLCEDLLAWRGGNAVDAAFRYIRLDGSTSRAKRNLGIRLFNQTASEFQVMLISTRAGGLGINLATASDVIFLDEDWNPQITLQAEARAHRIGQINPVTIYKICSQGTVEEQMMGRIRKKLYLSAKITESMRNIHTVETKGKKRKRESTVLNNEDDAPHLDASQLKSLLRKGASTLARPAMDVEEMLSWDFDTMIEKLKDNADDPTIANAGGEAESETNEQNWLNSMEKVECCLFEGKKHHRSLELAEKQQAELARADRRLGKNTTVMVDGFAISKDSMGCVDWEAVPTMAGKDPRLAEVKRVKKDPIVNQENCHVCWDGGDIVCCSGCPRSYHIKCLDKHQRIKAKTKMQYYCPQHECYDCEAKTTDAGGLIFRCRWCANGYCEECLDWDQTKLIGETLPELLIQGYGAVDQAWYIECPSCTTFFNSDPESKKIINAERKKRDQEYDDYAAAFEASHQMMVDDHETVSAAPSSKTDSPSSKFASNAAPNGVPNLKIDSQESAFTPATISEAVTPVNEEPQMPRKKWFSNPFSRN
ncbi:SWI/SNF chromatin remodeling complex component [Acrodontium crateriforme]|uniref:SWI/SNF chromatin remodeling complex component n=1 Tax=Acrodontium crateriforme TaxID=150365 RepID=A0AAQ3MBH4_9PEZI|nr:SWI/SNF chromatin remodeling complex component [Acrodontium crateriforme]